MTCRDTKCVYLCLPPALSTHCSKPVAPIVFNFTHCLQHVCNLLFRALLYWSRAILVTFSLYLSVISHIPAVQLFTHSLHSLPTITFFPPEFLIKNKSTKVALPSLEPVQSSPIWLSDSTVPRVGTSQTNASCPHSLLFNPNFLSAQPHNTSLTVGSIFKINYVFGPKNFEIPEIPLSA